tara:strand:+ start:459 stop:791 length:333 start_codon:yes stop_codon:yes gene_type:complete
MLSKPADKVIFTDNDLENSFLSLSEEDILKKAIKRTIIRLKENIFAGKNIPKKQIPKVYTMKYGIDNLWRYPLPNGWRLVYSVMPLNENFLLANIIDFFDHKTYERVFNY